MFNLLARLQKTKIAVLGIVMSFMVLSPVTPYLQLKTANAIACGNCFQEGSAWVQQAVDSGVELATLAAGELVGNLTDLQWWKEFFWDAMVWFLKEILLRQVMSDILTWINSGFENSPMFMQNFSGFIDDVADKAAGDIIDQQLGLGFLCSPFQLDIQIALEGIYRNSRLRDEGRACTLTGVVGNIHNFLSGGDFTEGGWQGWFDYSLNPSNNLYGSYIEAETIVRIGVENAANEQITLLDWGDGFMSSVFCDSSADTNGSGQVDKVESSGVSDCLIETPGKIIEDATKVNTNRWGPLSLIEADEINEILTAALVQLAKQGLGAVVGNSGFTPGLAKYDASGLKNECRERPAVPGTYTDSISDGNLLADQLGSLSGQVSGTLNDYYTVNSDLNSVLAAESWLSTPPSCGDLNALDGGGGNTYDDHDGIVSTYISQTQDNVTTRSLDSVVNFLNQDQGQVISTVNGLETLLDDIGNVGCEVDIDSAGDIQQYWNLSHLGKDYTDQYNSNDPLDQPTSEVDLVQFEEQTSRSVNGVRYEFSTQVNDFAGQCKQEIINRCEERRDDYILANWTDDNSDGDIDTGEAPTQAEAEAAVWNTDGCQAVRGISIPGTTGAKYTDDV